MTPSSDAPVAPAAVPVRVVLPADPLLGTPVQEVVARLWMRQQTPTGWLYQVGLPAYRNSEDGGVETVEYRVWVRAPEHVRPVDGVDYDQVDTERLEKTPQSTAREVLGERRPSGWVLQKLRDDHPGPDRSVLHTPDCEDAPHGAPLLDLNRALDAAQHPGIRLCVLCGCAQELRPLLKGFDHPGDGGSGAS